MTDFPSDPGAGSASTPRRRELERELRQRSSELADIYASALRVQADKDNPGRIALGAHAVRELMDKLPEYLDVPTPANHENLLPKVQELRDQWTTMVRKTKCLAMGVSTAEIDGHLGGFLDRLLVSPPRRHESRRIRQQLAAPGDLPVRSDRLVPRTFDDFAEIDDIVGGDDDA